MRDDSELNRFLASVERRAYRMAKIATRDHDEAMDIVQTAMLKLVKHYGDRESHHWGPLFTTILQNTLLDWHRKGRWRRLWVRFTAREEDNADADNDPIENIVVDPTPDITVKLTHEQALLRLETALHDLPLRQQQAFLLRAWEGLDVAETANAMGCSEGSVKTHYSRAIAALRTKLGDFDYATE